MTVVNKALAQSLITTPPRGYQPSGGPFGQEVVFLPGMSAVFVDLRSLTFGVTYDPTAAVSNAGTGAPAAGPVGAVGSYLTIEADGCDLGIVTGLTQASVTVSNAPNLATAGIVAGDGTYIGFGSCCHRIFNGTERRYRLQVGQDNFLGVVASNGTGLCRMYVSSEAGLQS
jgi:hypothetical protein